jgi:hypothetical protein
MNAALLLTYLPVNGCCNFSISSHRRSYRHGKIIQLEILLSGINFMNFSNSYAAQSFKIKLQNNKQCLFCNTNYWKRRYIGDSTECHCRSNFIGLFSCIFFLFCVFLLSSCNNLSNETVGYQNGIRWCLMMSFVCKVCTENALFKIYTNKNRYTM